MGLVQRKQVRAESLFFYGEQACGLGERGAASSTEWTCPDQYRSRWVQAFELLVECAGVAVSCDGMECRRVGVSSAGPMTASDACLQVSVGAHFIEQLLIVEPEKFGIIPQIAARLHRRWHLRKIIRFQSLQVWNADARGFENFFNA